MRRVLFGFAVCATMLISADQASAQVIIGFGGYSNHNYSRGHYDYHPGRYVPHQGHYDYVPGHFHYHNGSHRHGSVGGAYYSSPRTYGGYLSSPNYRYGGYSSGYGQMPYYRR